ncbi:BrnA antitoxin family protein [Niveispirillum sp. KHB5.9]|uniref:BrnA antitoxin family protein n=1 Tax=Niveispirillum sp. KHB5.9 TaxID=3400269 RepID=UPI003A8672B6
MPRKPLTNEDGEVRELTTQDFQEMRPAAKALPGLLGEELAAQLLQRRPGRGPQKAPTKAQVTLRLDPDLIQHFKRSGTGWQTRLNDTLRKAIGL